MSAHRGTELCSKLAELLNVPPISIELLPGDGSDWFTNASSAHAPFLFMDRNLGIPLKAAYKAYLEAVPRFHEARQRLLRLPRPLSLHDIAEAAAMSSVLLLVNPAHQSALNVRKRLMDLGSLDAAHELQFTNALLSLSEGAKQSILWQHRRWLLRHLHPPSNPRVCAPSQGDGTDSLYGVVMNAETFDAEFAIVQRAAEVYPRNYHAWAHRFLCAQALVSLLLDSSREAPPLLEVLEEEITRIRLWIERHVSDYSAMQYYCQLENLLPQDSPLRLRMPVTSAESSVHEHAMELVRAYPTHESLWLYLRSSLSFMPPKPPDAPMHTVEADALLVAEKYLSSRVASDRDARKHAVWLAAWMSWKNGGNPLNATIRRIASAADDSAPITVADLDECLRDHAG